MQNRKRKSYKQTDFEKMKQLLENLLDMLQSKKRKSIVKNAEKKLINLVSMESPSFPEDSHERIKCFNDFKILITKIIDQCQETDLTNLTLSIQEFVFKFVKKFFYNESKMKELLQLCVSMERSACVMLKHECEKRFDRIHELLKKILSEMQKEESVAERVKSHYVSLFLLSFGNCFYSKCDYRSAIETYRQAEILADTFLQKDPARSKILAYCYQNIAKSHLALKNKHIAEYWLQKVTKIVDQVTDWINDEESQFMNTLKNLEK